MVGTCWRGRARDGVAVVLCAEVSAGRPFVIDANAFVAVSCELLAQCFAVGKDEVIVEICDHYENSVVVRTIVINAIVHG